MPVIPSFGKFAATPDSSGAYLGGFKVSSDIANDQQQIAVARERIASEAAQSAARISLGREQIAAEATQNAMQLEAKKQFVASQAMKDAQDAEIEKAYREIQIGFKERELKNEEAVANMRLQEAARGFDQRMNYERRRSELVPTLGEQRASEEAMREFGFGEGGFGTAMSPSATKAPAMDARTKSSVKLLEQDINRKSKALLDIPDKEKNFEERNKLQNSIANDTFKLHRLMPPSAGAVAPEPAQQQWQVDPAALPFGAPKNPSSFVGTPPTPTPPDFGQIFPDVPMARTNSAGNSQRTLKILSVRKK